MDDKIVYGCIQIAQNVELKGMFTILGPYENILYLAKTYTYFGPFVNNSFEGIGIYTDLEQYFSYIGDFHFSMKEGFGVLLQYSKSSFENSYSPKKADLKEADFAEFSKKMQREVIEK